MRGDVDRVEKDVLELGAAIATQDANRVIDVAGINRVAFFQKTVELAENWLVSSTCNGSPSISMRRAAHANFHLQRTLKNFQVLVMLAQQIAEQSRIMKLEQIDADLGHGISDSLSFRLSLVFSYELDDDFACARTIVEIEQNHLLPGAQAGMAVFYRNAN